MIKEVDQNAPSIFKLMTWSPDPFDFYTSLNGTDKQTIDSWRHRRKDLLQVAHQQSIDSALSRELLARSPTPFIRAEVKILRRISNEGKQSRNSSAILTFWRPSDEQMSLLKEGSAVRLRKVWCKSLLHDGKLQLSATNKTTLEALPRPTSSVLQLSGYDGRKFTPIARLHIMSKQNDGRRASPEFDAVGYVAIQPARNNCPACSVYLTDQSGFLLRLERHFDSEYCVVPPWKTTKYALEESMMFAFHNLRLLEYDAVHHCAVALWTDSSVLVPIPNERLTELAIFSKSKKGTALLDKVAGAHSSGYTAIGKKSEKLIFAIGVVLSAKQHFTADNGETRVTVVIDCGRDALLRAYLPLELLKGMAKSLGEDDIFILDKELRDSGIYFSFILKQNTKALHSLGADSALNGFLEVVKVTQSDAFTLIQPYRLC